MKSRTPKSIFLLIAFVAGIIGSTALYFYWGVENTVMDRILINFHWYFGPVIIFWLWVGKELQVKGWLTAGLVGSLIYSLIIVLVSDAVSPLIGNPIESLWAATILIIISMIAGALGAVPQWLVSRNILYKAYQWIIANAVGYGLLKFSSWLSTYSYENDLLSFRQFIRNMSDVQVFNNLFHAFQYGLFGVILGIALFNFLKSKSEISFV